MNKGDLVNKLAEDAGITKVQATAALKSITSNITGALAQNDRVNIIGFGSFSTSDRAARTGRNPRTGEQIQIKARKVVHFKPGKAVDDALNG